LCTRGVLGDRPRFGAESGRGRQCTRALRYWEALSGPAGTLPRQLPHLQSAHACPQERAGSPGKGPSKSHIPPSDAACLKKAHVRGAGAMPTTKDFKLEVFSARLALPPPSPRSPSERRCSSNAGSTRIAHCGGMERQLAQGLKHCVRARRSCQSISISLRRRSRRSSAFASPR
jgi:hypothetical protein